MNIATQTEISFVQIALSVIEMINPSAKIVKNLLDIIQVSDRGIGFKIVGLNL